MDVDWVPEPKPVPPEISPNFAHATYPPPKVHWTSVVDQLDAATLQQLMELARGGVGEPDV